MNENIDLTKILDGCPTGTEFYSSVYGRVTFVKVISNKYYPILMKYYREGNNLNNIALFTKDGKADYQYNGECVLFPSKDQRDWSKFERFGDKPKVKKFDVNTLHAFDKVLVRVNNESVWERGFFGYKDDTYIICVSDQLFFESWKQCIPYNNETKNIVGKKDDCSEYYKWWEE